MARRIPLELGEEPIEPLPRRRRDRRLVDGAGNPIGAIGVLDQPLDGVNAPLALALDLTGQPRQQSQHAATLDFGG
jgi:hypothetical protein